MAEIQAGIEKNKHQRPRTKKKSTRIDLTPMVDLGFLLITFFIFTTAMSQPNVIKLIMPDDRPVKEPTTTSESKTISLMLGADDLVYYYYGRNSNELFQTDYSSKGLRAVIQQKSEQIKKRFGKPGELVVLIKPLEAASYKNIVDVLDEMQINEVKKYVLMEPGREELALFSKK